MSRMENSGGDMLARGAARFTFKPAGQKLSREAWDGIFAGETEAVVKATYVLKCPVHGTYGTELVAYVSGGYPQLDENLSVRCRRDNQVGGESCGEQAVYAGHEVIQESGSDSNSKQAGTVSTHVGEAVGSDLDIPF